MKDMLALTALLLAILIAPVAAAQEPDGQISGVVMDVAGKPLAGQRVELRRPRE
jgi:hypothetical protein